MILFGSPVPAALAYSGVFSWSPVAASPIARTEAQGGAVGGKIYVLGGFYNSSYQATTRSDAYNPASNSWSRLADMPEAITHAAVAIDGETIYLVGGYVGDHPGPSTARVLTYNTRANTWGEAPPLPAPRGAGTAAVVGRELHFFGGALRTGTTTNDADKTDHWVLNLDGGGSWVSSAALPLGRNHLGSAVVDGRIYIIGGQLGHNEGTTAQSRVDIYNPATNAWSQAASLPVGRSHIESSVLSVGGRIVVIGGSVNDNASGAPSSTVYIYDPQANVWMRMPSLPGGRKSPVAGYVGSQLFSLTGGTGSPSTSGWAATLPDRWETLASTPVALGEVAGGIIGGRLYLVGEGNSATLDYAFGTNSWGSASAVRPFVGHHHAAEVVGGKLYLFGGLGSGAGKVQIYNPATNSWSLGKDMPFAAGSSSSALIGGKVYVAGGIVGSSTSARTAVYDPSANSWAELAPMPQARNHAASATDGALLYVFGGRGPGSGDNNTVANGFNTVQIYNPATNTWRSSLDPGSALAPLPIGRGGMGKAVYAAGKFYVLGGETSTGPGATANNVYNRVDVYDPAANSWSELATMPTARHGMFPLLIGGRIYVAAGGTKAGFSQSSALEVFNLPLAAGSSPPPTATRTPTAAVTAPPAGADVIARINAGGPAVTVDGQSWGADQYFSGGKTGSAPAGSAVAGTDADELYLTDRSSGVGSFSYAIPVPAAASYRVRLHFAEIYFLSGSTGRRVFSVNLEGDPVEIVNLDLNAQVAPLTALVREFTLPISDGVLNISFTASVNNPTVAAIEVLAATAGTPTRTPTTTRTPTPTAESADTPTPTAESADTPTPTATAESTNTATPTSTQTSTPTSTAPPPGPEVIARINAGGPAVTANGQSWGADQYFSGGKTYVSTATAIAGTDADILYLSERSSPADLGSFSYAIPVPAAASYRVRLHFAEIYWTSGRTGRRVFSVNLEGEPVELTNLDLNAQSPPLTAQIYEFTLPVTDGTLNILFTASANQPKVSAIEVLVAAGAVAPARPTALAGDGQPRAAGPAGWGQRPQ